jgi:hypothetical protein
MKIQTENFFGILISARLLCDKIMLEIQRRKFLQKSNLNEITYTQTQADINSKLNKSKLRIRLRNSCI